ncbi:MAG: LacI family DNA-binding transcriptional regulator [Rhodospirillales bacterium]|nr:LacI family DNA-binding transcriptional regulator [Rhodospirillales bacterium]
MPEPTDSKLSDATPQRRRVTMRDVARRAGVGTITVSRAITDPAKVSPELRQRIEQAIRELGYVPNRMAGWLSSRRSRVVPVIVPAIRNAVFSDLVEGANGVFLEAGYQILLGATDYDPAREESLIADFLGWTPEGIIVVGTEHTEAARRLLAETEATVVELFELGRDPIDINIGFSNAEAARAMTDYLLDKGYQRIAFVGAYMEFDRRADQRREGFAAQLGEQGLSGHRLLAYPDKSSFELGARALRDLRERWPDTDAAFFTNDVLAVGALLEANRMGLAVPEDLAIAGFNGLDIGARTTPDLTTVVSPRFEMGQRAAEAVLERRGAGRSDPLTVNVSYTVLPRGSA